MLSSEGLSVVFVVRITLLQEFLYQHLVNGKIKQVHLRIQMGIVHTRTHKHTCILIICWVDLERKDFERKFSLSSVGYSLQVRNPLKSYYCLSFPVSLRDKDTASNMAFMYPRFFNASINYSLNSKKQRNTGSVFSTAAYRNYSAKGAAALLSVRPIVCRWRIIFPFAK